MCALVCRPFEIEAAMTSVLAFYLVIFDCPLLEPKEKSTEPTVWWPKLQP